MAFQPVFSDDQLLAFLQYIGLPPVLHEYKSTVDASKDLRILFQLHIHTISTVPYENLSLHYNPTHTITIKPQDTFQKVVVGNRGRGGYCMENSIFYNHVLRGLGFAAYLSAVRIRHRVEGVPQGDYSGWVHLVNLVVLSDGTKWMIDVGFGGDCAASPVQLVHDQPKTNLGAQEIRLIHDHIPSQLYRNAGTRLWIYQYRNGPEQEWNSFYAFGEAEAMEPDFHNMNWYTGSHPESFQTFTCLVVKFLRRPASNGVQEIRGKRMLVNGLVKENLGGKTSIVKDCKTEDERLAALEKWFGITFTKEEQEGIRGWRTELGRITQPQELWHVQRGQQWKYQWAKST